MKQLFIGFILFSSISSFAENAERSGCSVSISAENNEYYESPYSGYLFGKNSYVKDAIKVLKSKEINVSDESNYVLSYTTTFTHEDPAKAYVTVTDSSTGEIIDQEEANEGLYFDTITSAQKSAVKKAVRKIEKLCSN